MSRLDPSVVEELNYAPPQAVPASDGLCPHRTLWKPSCKRRGCPVCGPRWARDWQRVLGVNLEAVGGPVATIAITGPGADRLPWDEDHCSQRQRHKHSGMRGCRVQERPLREWCETLGYRWKLLRDAARKATKDELARKGLGAPPWLLTRVWEPQKRGVPHLHLVVPYGSFAERHAARVFRKHLARLVGEYDFGHVQGRLQPLEGREAARYLANYLAGRTGKKTSIRANIADPKLPRSLLWLTPRLTRETLVTMRTLRRARHLWAAMAGACDPPRWSQEGPLEEAVRIAAVFRKIYPKRAGPPVDVEAARSWARRVDRRLLRRRELAFVLDGVPYYGLPEWDDRELVRTAFLVTRDPEWRREGAAA